MKNKIMTLAVVGLDVFPKEIKHDGKNYKVQGCSIYDTFEELERARSLLKDLVLNYLDEDVLNQIGLSHEDLSKLGMSTEEELINNKIPPRKAWFS